MNIFTQNVIKKVNKFGANRTKNLNHKFYQKTKQIYQYTIINYHSNIQLFLTEFIQFFIISPFIL